MIWITASFFVEGIFVAICINDIAGERLLISPRVHLLITIRKQLVQLYSLVHCSVSTYHYTVVFPLGRHVADGDLIWTMMPVYRISLYK